MTTPILVMVFAGAVCGLMLFVASKYFFIQKDEKVELISNQLGGANCGACGFASCTELAKGISSGEVKPNACPALAGESLLSIEMIIGASGTVSQSKKAYVACSGTNCVKKFEYEGVNDCVTISMLNGGNFECSNACLGAGNCERKCPFDAISIVDGVAVIDTENCTGCGVCVDVCPKNIIKIYKNTSHHVVTCSSNMKGGEKRKICPTACIGCTICQKKCPVNAITITNFLATIDNELCTDCGECLSNCPTKAIKSMDYK